MSETYGLLLLPHLRIQNANAISGPFTWGFPSPTAFQGFVHALQRKLQQQLDFDDEVTFGGVGIICHHFEAQVSQPAMRRHKVFNLSRNPLGKNGTPSALVEEGRTHLEVSLVIEVLNEFDDDEQTLLLSKILGIAHSMRLAGGSILPTYEKRHQPDFLAWFDTAASNREAWRKLRYRLLPGFALIERPDTLNEHLTELREKKTESNALDALLDLTRLNIEPGEVNPKNTNETLWKYRSKPGWLVPLPVGYAAISPLYSAGEVLNTRDENTPFRFVESIYSLGQWLSPHRLTELDQLLWQQTSQIDNGLYRCTNQYANTTNHT